MLLDLLLSTPGVLLHTYRVQGVALSELRTGIGYDARRPRMPERSGLLLAGDPSSSFLPAEFRLVGASSLEFGPQQTEVGFSAPEIFVALHDLEGREPL